jgi:poly(A) polymerase
MNLKIPAHLTALGTDAYLVGGAVRDLVRGRRPADYDVVTDGDPALFARNLARRLGGRVVALGRKPFDLFRVIDRRGPIDVTGINGADIESDLLSRDFTINALACRLDDTRVIDCTGGLADLKRGILRMVSARNLQNDPVRLLRAHRMAADLGFRIEPMTRRAIRQHAPSIKTAAGERIWAEWQLILNSATSHIRLSDMAADGLLEAILPEVTALRRCGADPHHAWDALTHTLVAFQALEDLLAHPERHFPAGTAPFIRQLQGEERLTLKMAILLHDIGKPARRGRNAAGNVHYHGHASGSAAMADLACRRLRAPNRVRTLTCFIVRHHQRPLFLYLNPSIRAAGRFHRLCAAHAPLVLLHAIADTLGKSPGPATDQAPLLGFLQEMLGRYYAKTRHDLQAPRLLGGRDLMDHFGLAPSPRFKTLLDAVEEARLAGLVADKAAALRWVEQYMRSKT